jgi:pilus assembly protein Flp/PilA
MNRLHSLLRDAAGATSIEYAAVASLISIVAIGAIGTLGSAVNALFSSIPSF